MQDNFDKAREAIWQLPGFQKKETTKQATGWSFIPTATWIVESISTDDKQAIFIQSISAEGSQRIAIPDTVAKIIYGHYERLKDGRRKIAGKRAAETRKRKQATIPVVENEADQIGNK